MPGLPRAPCAETPQAVHRAPPRLLQVTCLVHDVESDIVRLRPGTEATAWSAPGASQKE